MKTIVKTPATRFAAALASLALAATSVHATLVQTKVFSTTELAYAADVSNSDLLSGLTPTTTGWNLTNGSTTAQLNDGIHGVSFATAGNKVQGTWTTVGATATYNLGLGVNNLGYDLASIQTIAAWANVGFGNQAYTVDVKLKGAASYTTLATVDYEPLNNPTAASNIGATKVTLTDDGGLLASGVEFIRFTANSVNGGALAGAFVFRELDVFGSPTGTPPQISSLAPLDNASGVPVGANLVATFTKNVARGSGNITIKNLDTSALTVIPLADSQISISGAILTINPTSDLAAGTNYAIRIDAGAIKDLANTPFAGISDDTTWKFTTDPDVTVPTLVTLSPTDNASGVAGGTDLVATFSEMIARGSGNITIEDLSDATQTVIAVGDPQVSVSGAVLTINPTLNLAPLKTYAIRIDPGAITDLNDNRFAGIADDTTWKFTTKAADAQEFSTTEMAFAGFVSASDLLNGLTPSATTGWNYGNSAHVNKLTDGIHGGTFTGAGSVVDGAWTTVGATAEYTLGTGPGGAGYDINSIQSIAAWTNVNFGNQAWTVEVKPVSGSWSSLATVNYQPLTGGGGSTKVTLTAPGGVLASGVQFIRFTANQVNGGANAGAFVWRELDVFGVPTAGNTFSAWIAGFPAVGALSGFNDDPDGDGIANGLENFFGTNPGKSSGGLVPGAKSGNTFTFSHPQNATPASDVSAAYRWSKDLAGFHAAGATDLDGTTVTLVAAPDTPAPGITTVTASVTGTPAARLFVRVEVSQN